MTIKVEVGKYYRTREGLKVGPMSKPVWRGLVNDPEGELWNESDGVHGDRDSRTSVISNVHRKDLIAEWTDEHEDKPKTWGEMSDAEKGALLLGQHNGARIQWLGIRGWRDVERREFFIDTRAYRIKSEPKFTPDELAEIAEMVAKELCQRILMEKDND